MRDAFGVIWDRRVDKDIGVVTNLQLPDPDLSAYRFPNPAGDIFFASLRNCWPASLTASASSPLVFRSMNAPGPCVERSRENLMMDFIEHPDFVRELLHAIADFNLAQIRHALTSASTRSISATTGVNSRVCKWAPGYGE